MLIRYMIDTIQDKTQPAALLSSHADKMLLSLVLQQLPLVASLAPARIALETIVFLRLACLYFAVVEV